MVKNLLKNLNISIESPYLETAYQSAINDVDAFYLKEEFIEELNTYYGVIPKNYEVLKKALIGVREQKDLSLFVKVLYHLINLRKSVPETFLKITMPKAPKNSKNPIAYDCASVFAVLAHVPNYTKELKARGVNDEIIRDTVRLLDVNMAMASDKAKKPVFDLQCFLSYNAFIYTDILWVGRFRFEIAKSNEFHIYAFKNKKDQIKVMMRDVYVHESGHIIGEAGFDDKSNCKYATLTETEEYFEGYVVDEKTSLVIPKTTRLDKKEWKLFLKPDDYVLNVHIPFEGEFSKEIIESSFKKGVEVFKKCYTEYDFKAFLTFTWFLAPKLKDILKETSNIFQFRNCFNIFPMCGKGLDIYEYVFNTQVKSISELNVDELPADNSLRRGVKEYTKNGIIFHEFGGVRLFK